MMHTRRIITILPLLFPAALGAQRLDAIREADLKRDLFAMASPAMRGREGGTLDELAASMWVAEEYRKIGLEPAGENGTWFQWFNIVRTRVSLASSMVRVGTEWLTLYRDIIPLGAVAMRGGSNVLWLADPADTTVNVANRVVATRLRAPAPESIRPYSYPYNNRYATAAINATLATLSRRGAMAILLVADSTVDANFDALAVMRGRGDYDVDDATPRSRTGSRRVAPLVPPGAPVALEPVQGPRLPASPAFMVRASMAAVLQQNVPVSLLVNLERFDYPSVNVIGVVRGTDPVLRNEYVLYSSHQDANGVRLLAPNDSVLAGADDNGSTTVAHLAAARAFMAQRPKRSILIVNHGSEERGLLGSRYHSAHPVVPLEQIVAVLNGDMVGRNHPDTAALMGTQPPHRNSPELVAMALAANAATGKFVIDSTWDRPNHVEGWYFRSDHSPYARLRVPAIYYSTLLHDDYHTAQDVPERINYPKLTRMAQWMYMTGWLVANAPKRPALDPAFQLER